MFLVNAEGGTFHVSLVPFAEPIVEPAPRAFEARLSVSLSQSEFAHIGDELNRLGWSYEDKWEFLFRGYDVSGFLIRDPKLVQVICCYF